jgi:hypothetical protein
VDDVYVAARRVLLDALEALGPHRVAATLVGAQAVYLRVGDADIAVAPTTTDGDLALNPALLLAAPPLERLMRGAGFERRRGDDGKPLVGVWARTVNVATGAQVTVDLLMPEAVATAAGRRAARLDGHETGTVLKVPGLESALVDADVMRLAAFEATDDRRFDIPVAGPAALLVAKVHKIADREDNPGRLEDKDALDVFRLLRGTPTDEMARRVSLVLSDSRSADSARVAIAAFPALFAQASGSGVLMALRATAGLMADAEVAASLVALARDLSAKLIPAST